MNQHYTPKALAALDREIKRAEDAYSKAMLSMGESAEADNNTWHDNPAFEQAKMEVDQARINLGRLRQLRKNAVVTDAETGSVDNEVRVGSEVMIHIRGDESPTAVRIAGHYVAGRSEEGTVFELATTSPLGAALLGAKVGETVSYVLPSGKDAQAAVINIV